MPKGIMTKIQLKIILARVIQCGPRDKKKVLAFPCKTPLLSCKCVCRSIEDGLALREKEREEKTFENQNDLIRQISKSFNSSRKYVFHFIPDQ